MPHKPSALASVLLVLMLLLAVAPGSMGATVAPSAPSPGSPGITLRVSVSSGGAEGNLGSYAPSISADGYSVAFDSLASTLVPGDTNECFDVFVQDWKTGVTERVSVASDGGQVSGASLLPSLSASGQVVAFESSASTLVPGDNNGVQDVFVRDRTAGTTERVSVASDGAEANGASGEASISGDGRYVAFTSVATNLVAEDTNDCADIFVHDRGTGTTIRVSVASDGTPGNGDSGAPSISSNGQIVAFESYADTLVADDTNGEPDVFVHDRTSGATTERVSVASDGTQGNYMSYSPWLSGDGRYVAFPSNATTLVSDDTNDCFDIFVHDRQTDQTERVSLSHDGSPEDGHSEQASISDDGRYVAFVSYATTLVVSDTNGVADIFVRDRNEDVTTRVSVASDETESNGLSEASSISGTGRYVAFHSSANNLVSDDFNGAYDVFLHDRESVYDPPEAWFTAWPTDGVAPLSVSFTNQSTGDVDTWAWRFGDESTSDEPSPSHVYAAKGVYSVSLTVSGLSGTDTVTRSHYITAYAPAHASFTAVPTEGVAPLNVSFTNHSSGDYDTCAWAFGDDGASPDCNDPDHEYMAKGVYTPSLTVSGLGGTDTFTHPHPITVHGPAKAAFWAEPTQGVAPLGVEFTNTSSGDYDTCAWDFGDDCTSDACEDPGHVYAAKGVYTVRLTVSGLGGTDTRTRSGYISVYDPALADFTASPTQGPAPLTVRFTNGSTGDYDACAWRFGDGHASDDCADPTHTYTGVQPYTVSLTVSGLGGTDVLTRSRYITTYHPVQAGFTAVPTHGLAPLSVTFTNDSTGDYDACAWRFGDGETSDDCQNPGHTYTAAGPYTPGLTVTGLGGTQTLTRSHYITAYGPVRARFWAAPTQGPAPLEVTFTNRSAGDYDTCAWGFGDGHTSDDCSGPTHVYTTVAAYSPTLTVSGLGGTHALTRSHYITTYHPAQAGFTAVPTQGLTPLTVTFTNESTGEYDACAWDFGDDHASSDCDDPVHVYTTTGPCTVRLTVTGLGGTHSLTRTDYVLPYGPARARFAASPTHGPTPLTVRFANQSTGGYDTCAWRFGDGSSSDECDDPTHVYTPTGAYTVSLRVSGLGGSHTLTRTQYITVVPPTYGLYLPVILRRSP